ncbi:MAG: energy transducer TonB [Xanthomonadaceae bacterium]|nr:energy transducer TonB [Xanthomonadaceae bacterium]
METRHKLQHPVVISLTIHLLFILFLIAIGIIQNQMQSSVVQIEWIDSKDSKNQAIVKSDQGEEVVTPDKKAFLGEKNRTVIKQTVARNSTLREKAVAKPKLANLGVSLVPKDNSGTKSGDMFKSNYSQFSQAIQQERPAGGDFVKGFEEAGETALNTKEFVFYGYFQRIRTQLDQAWQPILRKQIEGMFRKGRRLASEMEYLTKTVVVLNTKGEVVEVRVLEESGTRALDDAAIKAFNSAGPFPNPPGGLSDASGNIQIRWDFLLRT